MEAYRRTPFFAPVVANDLTFEHPRIRGIGENRFLVRAYGLSTDKEASAEVLTYYKEAISRWKRLGTYPGIELPAFTPVIGSLDSTSPSLLIATERIKGKNLQDTIFEAPELPQAKVLCTNLMLSLVKYSQDVFEGRGNYLSDQKLSQYVYRKSKFGDSKIFFVDFGLENHFLPKDRGQHHENSYFFGSYMLSLFTMLEGLEKKVGEPLVKGRFALAKFLSSIPQGSGGISYAQSLQRELLQDKLGI